MESYRYQQLVYLIVPILLGIEFFLCAKEERKGKETAPVGSYLLDLFGFIFVALIPAMFFFMIWAVEYKAFPLQVNTLARIDRYGVLFFFFGAWWQVYIFAALRARRIRLKNGSKWMLWIPYLLLGIFISLLILLVSPWNMKWISVIWFLMLFACMIKASMKTVEKVFWILAGITFFVENVLFIWLESVV